VVFLRFQGVVQRYHKFIYRNSTNYPYISGDSFKALADFVYKKELGFEYSEKTKESFGVVFCKSEDLEQFSAELPKKFKPKILIVGNGDRDFENSNISFPLSVSTVLLQNSHISDNKYVWTLPLGVENIRLGKNGLPKFLTSPLDFSKKKNKVLFGPFGDTHLSRRKLVLEKEQNDYFIYPEEFLSTKKYAKTVQGVKWVACPRGNGTDTHRLWETLYRGSIPIVKESQWSNSLRWLDMPMLIVSELKEDQITKQTSKKKIVTARNPKTIPSLWMPFWIDFINNRLNS